MSRPLQIDLNCDMGEIAEAVVDGTQEALLRSVTSVNIACGGHAGDEHTMRATIDQALRWNVAIGAHPGYPDRANFGRRELNLSPQEVADTVFEQVSALAKIAAECSARIVHVKPHGALYNQAAHNHDLAAAIAQGVACWNAAKDVVIVGLAGSPMLEVFRDAGFAVAAEAFADRRYEPDGSLRSRKFPDALISDPAAAAQQALNIVQHNKIIAWDGTAVPIKAQTICIHADTPGAAAIAAQVSSSLQPAGVQVRALPSAELMSSSAMDIGNHDKTR